MHFTNYSVKSLFLAGSLLISSPVVTLGQSRSATAWTNVTQGSFSASSSRSNLPVSYRAVRLDLAALQNQLAAAPMENSAAARKAPLEVTLPMPDGSNSRFSIVESPVMAPALAAKYPQIKTYAGQGIDDRTATIRFDITPEGFHAQILSVEGASYIDPFTSSNTTDYMCYRKADLVPTDTQPVCRFSPTSDPELEQSLTNVARITNQNQGNNAIARSHGTQLRTYRLALACTGEYAATKGGTVTGALAGMVTSVNRVDGIYEKELAIRLVLIGNTDTLIFLNSSTDPYSNNNGGTMLGQNQVTVDSRIGNANYDIGHVFSTGGGGIAGLGVPCRSGQKARGVTGLPNPVGDAFDVDYVAHEMGHQFGGNHTFNSTAPNCNGNGNSTTAYEPGSGSTIMAYAGICSPHNIQNNSNPYFHTISFDEMVTYTTQSFGNTCPVTTPTNNTPPVVAPGTTYNIPYRTPFKLTAEASDPDGDAITYCIEQFDRGPFGAPLTPSGNAPIFRSWNPTTNNFRFFPRLNNIILNNFPTGELLPTYERNMHFRVTARDNRIDGGGVTYNPTPITVNAIDTGAPFLVTNPNTAITWTIGNPQSVTWDVAGSDLAPIFTSQVHIILSLDGGLTFSDTLAANVPNTGSFTITVPNTPSTTARVIIAGANNVFFDMSNTNFAIAAANGAADNVLAAGLQVYPNPTESEFTVSLSAEVTGPVTITLADVVGRQISTSTILKNTAEVIQTLDLSSQAKGTYLVQVRTAQGTAVKRIVKM